MVDGETDHKNDDDDDKMVVDEDLILCHDQLLNSSQLFLTLSSSSSSHNQPSHYDNLSHNQPSPSSSNYKLIITMEDEDFILPSPLSLSSYHIFSNLFSSEVKGMSDSSRGRNERDDGKI